MFKFNLNDLVQRKDPASGCAMSPVFRVTKRHFSESDNETTILYLCRVEGLSDCKILKQDELVAFTPQPAEAPATFTRPSPFKYQIGDIVNPVVAGKPINPLLVARISGRYLLESADGFIAPLYQIRSLYGPAELEVPESNLKQIPADNACASVELYTDETQKPFLLSLHANVVTSKDLCKEKAKRLTDAFVLLAQQVMAE